MDSEYFGDFGDKLHAVIGDVVESADEGADERSACASGEKSLSRTEYESDVGLDTDSSQLLYR